MLSRLQKEVQADIAPRYNISKLLVIFYVRALAQHLTDSKKPEIILNTLTPGLCHSELGRDMGFFFAVIKLSLARTTEAGSRSLVHSAGGGEKTHGQWLWNCTVAK